MEMALNSVKLIYFGKPFIILGMFLFVMEYCHIHLPRLFITFLVAIQTSITFLVFTCENNRLYYSSIEFTDDGIFPHLILGHGIVYLLYVIIMTIYFLAIIGASFNYYKKVNTNIERTQIKFIIAMITVSIASLIIYLCGLTYGYDSTLIGYLISTILLSVSMFKYKLFDTITLAKDEALDQFKDGIIVLNNNEEMLYLNQQAMDIYPELKSFTNSKDSNALFEIRDIHDSGEKLFSGDKIYSIDNHQIIKNNVAYGHMYIFNDITDSYNYTNRLQRDVAEKTSHIQMIQRKITLGMADMIESRDSNTGGHVKRTSAIIKIFVDELKNCDSGLNQPDSFYENVINAAPMHDLGKIAVSDAILCKPGAFTPEEYEEMKTHAEKGAVIVNQVLNGIEDEDFLRIATNIAHYHHEKWNGQGYPCGLTGEDIPLEARIMALADVFDALVSKRCYKEKMSFDSAFDIIKDSLGSHFDSNLGTHFIACRDKLVAYYKSVGEE
jgi:putative two-component system response regulator